MLPDNSLDKPTPVEIVETKAKDGVQDKLKPVNYFVKIGNINVYGFEKLPPFIKEPLRERYGKFYQKRRWHLISDILLLFIIIESIIITSHLVTHQDAYLILTIGRYPIISWQTGQVKEIKPAIKQELILPRTGIINQGEAITIKIMVDNTTELDWQAVELTSQLAGQNLKFQIGQGNLTIKQDVLPTKQTLANELTINNIQIDSAELSITSQLTFVAADKSYTVVSPPLIVKVSSTLDLTAQAKYYTAEGDQLGFGLLPPRVNQTTSYWLIWQLQNGSNDLTNVSVSGILPEQVTFTGKSSVNSGQGIEYNPETRTVSWKINQLPKQAAAQAGLEVAITPLSNQLNTSPPLLTKIKATADDAYTGKTIEKTADDVTTALNDFGNNGELGRVTQ